MILGVFYFSLFDYFYAMQYFTRKIYLNFWVNGFKRMRKFKFLMNQTIVTRKLKKIDWLDFTDSLQSSIASALHILHEYGQCLVRDSVELLHFLVQIDSLNAYFNSCFTRSILTAILWASFSCNWSVVSAHQSAVAKMQHVRNCSSSVNLKRVLSFLLLEHSIRMLPFQIHLFRSS